MTAAAIAEALEGRRTGREWRCICPVHGGRSLTIGERGGRVLLKCWSGCEQSQVLAELRARALWPEKPRTEWTPADRREWARRKADAERVTAYGRALRRHLEDMKADAFHDGRWYDLAALSARLHRTKTAGGLVRDYRLMSTEAPRAAARLVREDAADLEHARHVTAAIVAMLSAAELRRTDG